MARRRNSNRRRRRGRFVFLYKLLSILVICGVIIAALTLFFRVDSVEIQGNQRYTTEEVRKESGVKTGHNLFLMNKYRIASSLLSKLPYIEQVRISRHLPDQLVIQVTECTTVLAVKQDGSTWLVSPSGKIVAQAGVSEASKYAVIDGFQMLSPSVGSAMAVETALSGRQESLLSLLGALEKSGMLDQVKAIHLGDASVLTMDYAGRFSVELSYGADYAYKLQNLQAVIGKLESNETGTINLRVDGKANFIPGK